MPECLFKENFNDTYIYRSVHTYICTYIHTSRQAGRHAIGRQTDGQIYREWWIKDFFQKMENPRKGDFLEKKGG